MYLFVFLENVMSPLAEALEFSIETIFGLYSMILLVRFLLSYFRANFFNPLSQFVVQITNPVLRPFHLIIPRIGGIDIACLLCTFAVMVLKVCLLSLNRGVSAELLLASYPRVMISALAQLTSGVINIFMFSIIISSILSWVAPGGMNPMGAIFYQLSEPLLKPFRRLFSNMGGLDFSPMLTIFVLTLLKIVLVGWVSGL